MGVHFRSGEWQSDSDRCGSVVTCTKNNQSYYGRVKHFLKLDGDDTPGFASVRWFSKPTYPAGVPLVVRVEDDGSDVDLEFGSIIRLVEIEPSRVMVESSVEEPNVFYIMRDSGYDKC